MENEFVPIKKGEDEAYTNKMELESGPKTLMGFLMQTHLEEIHVLWSQSLEMTVVLSTDNSATWTWMPSCQSPGPGWEDPNRDWGWGWLCVVDQVWGSTDTGWEASGDLRVLQDEIIVHLQAEIKALQGHVCRLPLLMPSRVGGAGH